MTDTFNNVSPTADPGKEAGKKKRELWRNVFLFNLCITFVLVGIFWLPIKLVEMEAFFNSPSVNLPKKGQIAQTSAQEVQPVGLKNVLSTRIITINASSEKDWTYFDFSRGSEVRIHDTTSMEWDLAFRRGKMISNGGATNKFGGAGLIDLRNTNFDSFAEVPLTNYTQDSATRTETENSVVLKWYKYNYLTHKLTPKRNIYAVQTADKKFAKVQFLSFYCDNDETGCIKMKYVYQENGSNSFLKTAAAGHATSVVAAQPKEPGAS